MTAAIQFTCSICGEGSTRICARCTKDACDNHICEKCLCCSDCCECEVTLDDSARPVVRPAMTMEPEPVDDVAPEAEDFAPVETVAPETEALPVVEAELEQPGVVAETAPATEAEAVAEAEPQPKPEPEP